MSYSHTAGLRQVCQKTVPSAFLPWPPYRQLCSLRGVRAVSSFNKQAGDLRQRLVGVLLGRERGEGVPRGGPRPQGGQSLHWVSGGECSRPSSSPHCWVTPSKLPSLSGSSRPGLSGSLKLALRIILRWLHLRPRTHQDGFQRLLLLTPSRKQRASLPPHWPNQSSNSCCLSRVPICGVLLDWPSEPNLTLQLHTASHTARVLGANGCHRPRRWLRFGRQQ